MISGIRLYLPVICIIWLCSVYQGSAQSISEEGDILSTQATNPKARPDAKKQGPKKKKIRYIVRSDSKGALKGNKCFEEVINNFGFEYLIVPKKMPPYQSGFSRFMHNLGVKTVLFFRNGPCWQLRLKKKYKQCRYQYGDFTG
jgi:hypothetical protein